MELTEEMVKLIEMIWEDGKQKCGLSQWHMNMLDAWMHSGYWPRSPVVCRALKLNAPTQGNGATEESRIKIAVFHYVAHVAKSDNMREWQSQDGIRGWKRRLKAIAEAKSQIGTYSRGRQMVVGDF